MAETGRFYQAVKAGDGSHLALRWKGRVRYTVPRQAAGQQACWQVFRPGLLEWPLRAMARLPRMLGAQSCVEGDAIEQVRGAIGGKAGLSCCRAGAEGVWSKDTVLFLDEQENRPLYIAKLGAGTAVDLLLKNEAEWLRRLGSDESLREHVPALLAHRSTSEACFVVQRAVSGEMDFSMGAAHFEFLRKLQRLSLQSLRFEDSRFSRTLHARMEDLNGKLAESWSRRLHKAIERLEKGFGGHEVLVVAAHKDFTPWNVRIEGGSARVFDWEFADEEQLPLIDPLHFELTKMALKNRPGREMIEAIRATVGECRQHLNARLCYQAQMQALAYLAGICIAYLWSVEGSYETHPVLDSYARVMDLMMTEEIETI